MNIQDKIQIKQVRESIITALKQCEADAIAGHPKDFQLDWNYMQKELGKFLKLANECANEWTFEDETKHIAEGQEIEIENLEEEI